MAERKRVLITVKTYPIPSKKYGEYVCTAGICADGSFIRLYPIQFRFNSTDQQYKKYQWIEVDVEKNRNDTRPESYLPLGNIKLMGSPISTKNNWAERKKFVLNHDLLSMCDLEMKPQTEVSLSIIKPKTIEDFVVEESENNWNKKQLAQMNQLKLFKEHNKQIEKIPYKFSYKFRCTDNSCNGHKKMIEDWEIYMLFRKMRDKFKSEEIAISKVKEKYYDEYCNEETDLYLFVGTTKEYGSWVIIGTFTPKKEDSLNYPLFNPS